MQNNSASFTGILYVVATPIGNLGDITFRAVETLKSVDTILAEDTRHSTQLCNALGIQKPLISLHAHNESQKCEQIIGSLKEGRCYALISDAGTPLISDPGFVLVKEAVKAGIRVVPIPGCCALIAALSCCGIPCDSFTFCGFLPAKSAARKEKLSSFQQITHTIIVYESTHRIVDCIDDIIEIYGENYNLVLAKELTKNFETLIHDKAVAIKNWLQNEAGRVKGEFVLIFPALPAAETEAADEKLLKILLKEMPLKQAVKLAEMISGTSKNILYRMALQLNDTEK